ncbi:MAG TPA: ribonuclease J, partial [Patescibacteria group bacterium]|nr:ribonuclease J [Patescibacteria group bacterium]
RPQQGRRYNGGNQSNGDNRGARPQESNTVLAKTQIRRGEVQRATRRTSEMVGQVASQHQIDVPVNKSIYNGYGGQQFTLNQRRLPNQSSEPTLKIIPIGGLGEMTIGKNMMAIEYKNDIIIIDMGLLFPGADYPGINYIVPDISYLEQNKHKIRGIVFTHGHLDHIGGVRHLLHRLPVPIYGSKFTLAMVERMMEESDTNYRPIYNVMNPEAHERVQLGESFSIELIRMAHSIPDATAVIIRTPVGVLMDTGDWRFEERPVDGRKVDLDRLQQIAREEKILLLMNESTNCESQGSHSHGEYEIAETFGNIMARHAGSRIIVATFSSQIHRIQMILEQAQMHNRKVALAGYSMLQNIEVALRSEVVKVPKDVIVRMEELAKLPDSQTVIVCTGSQGEFNAVLNRMASGIHKHIKVKHSDIIVLSASEIPGNEKYIVRTVDNLMREGSDVLQDRKAHLDDVGPLHLSGHAYYDDHVKLIKLLQPKYYLPIHGEFHMLVHNAELAEKCGVPRENILVSDSGDVIEISHDGLAKKTGRITVGGIMYDDSGAVVSEVVLKDRVHMSSEGMFVVVLTISKKTGRLLTSPDIISRGFIYMKGSEELMDTIRQYLKQKVARSFGAGRRIELDSIKKEIKDDIGHILYDKTRRTPVIIPVINEISSQSSQPQFQPQAQPQSQREQSQIRQEPIAPRPVAATEAVYSSHPLPGVSAEREAGSRNNE